jgi:ribonuclease P protein component
LEKKNYVGFTKKQRVKAALLFQKIYKSGRSVVDSYGVFYILPSTDGQGKIGLAVGKRIGNAVIRNRVKRLMREVYRTNQEKLSKPVYIIWVARQRLANADLPTFERVFNRLAAKAGLLKGK